MITRLPEAVALARRFHATLERNRPRPDGEVAWEDMPESYQRRLSTAFDSMVRDGSIQAGVQLDFTEAPKADQPPAGGQQ